MLLNEAGVYTSNDMEQARENVKKLLWSMANNHKMFVWYTSRGYGGNHGWAIINDRGEPREAFIAYGNAIRQMNGAEFVQSIANHGYYVHLYHKGNKSVVTAFKDGSALTADLYITKDIAYTVYDFWGNEVQIDGSVSIDVLPVYIQIDGNIDGNNIDLDILPFFKRDIDREW